MIIPHYATTCILLNRTTRKGVFVSSSVSLALNNCNKAKVASKKWQDVLSQSLK